MKVELIVIENKSKRNTLSKEEVAALTTLSIEMSIVIKAANKWSAVVLMGLYIVKSLKY